MAFIIFEHAAKRFDENGRLLNKRKRRARQKQRPTPKQATAYNEYINSAEWRAFRLQVFAERGRACQKCGSKDGSMHVHHLHYRTLKRERLQDVQVLCEGCHSKQHPERFARWFAKALAVEAGIASGAARARKAREREK